ncbi:MAG: sulfatase-like hydrolase/transferase [Clostridia bacterium]
MAVDYIHRNSGRNPWFLVLSWGPPHDPYHQVPQKYLDMYRDIDMKLRPNVPELIRTGSSRTMKREDIVRNYRGYYAHITALDEQFGRLMAVLVETGEIDNTIVVYTSDHGDMLGSQGTTNKQWAYEESIKVPLIVYWKGKTIQTSSDELIGLVDLPVSLLDLLGLRFSGNVDGKDLHELFINPDAKGLEECYIFDHIPCHQAFFRGSSEWRGIRTRRYTYARTAADDGYMLYDNLEDPYQMVNRINDPDYEQIKKDLKEKLNEYIQKHDKLLPWQDFIKEFGLKDEWNRSQTYFKLPLLE